MWSENTLMIKSAPVDTEELSVMGSVVLKQHLRRRTKS